MKSFTIGKNEANQRFDKFITKTVPSLPKSLMYKYLRTKRIKLNGKKAEISTKLNEGDLVEMYINDEFFVKKESVYDFMRASKEIDIVYEDENLILLNKKVGLLCHPDNEEYVDTLVGRVKRYLYEKNEYNPDEETSFTPSLVNRIDRNTGGIVIAAKNAEALRILNKKLKDREIEKYYLCVIEGVLNKKSDTLKGYLIKNEDKNIVKIYSKEKENSKEIKTEYRIIDENNGFSLAEVHLLTGRTHQIRAHFSSIGHPLAGDIKYGSKKTNKENKRQLLYSYKIVFNFTTDAGCLDYLNNKEFSVDNIWFLDDFYKGKI
ncbi:MAG: RluA family pseudouridine synthase [Ruminococcaceae bacterium]|nr:RluA family pseudouridine synthase [Oscillospiraceae bacterium]